MGVMKIMMVVRVANTQDDYWEGTDTRVRLMLIQMSV